MALGCVQPLNIAAGGKLNLESGVPFGLGFGTAISADAVGTTLILQPGLYNVHFEAWGVQPNTTAAVIAMTLNGQLSNAGIGFWQMTLLQLGPPPLGFIIGDNFVPIATPNTTATFVAPTGMNFSGSSGCLVNITKLQ